MLAVIGSSLAAIPSQREWEEILTKHQANWKTYWIEAGRKRKRCAIGAFPCRDWPAPSNASIHPLSA